MTDTPEDTRAALQAARQEAVDVWAGGFSSPPLLLLAGTASGLLALPALVLTAFGAYEMAQGRTDAAPVLLLGIALSVVVGLLLRPVLADSRARVNRLSAARREVAQHREALQRAGEQDDGPRARQLAPQQHPRLVLVVAVLVLLTVLQTVRLLA